jgi:hypothetical protein
VLDVILWFCVAAIAVYPSVWGLGAAVALFAGLFLFRRFSPIARARV